MSRGQLAVRGHRPDYVLALGVFMLLVFGLVMIYSVSPVLSHKLVGSADRNYYLFGQLKNLGIGIAAWIFAANFNYRHWKKLAPWLLIVAIIALLALLVPSFNLAKNGATRWLNLGWASFQPAELLKIAMILYLATWFERRGSEIRSFWDGLLPFTIILGLASIVLVLFQRDFGSMAVLAASVIGMFYVAGMRLTHLAALLTGAGAAAWLAIVSFPHRLSRVTTFLDPTKDASGSGYHINQALIAVGSGGPIGLGLGRSIQVYGYLPEAANDSIFAIIAEEFGLIGSLIVVGLLGVVVHRGLKIARGAPDGFARLVATGIALWLLFQSAINIGAMLGLLPLTGIPLPFISYGGSSLVFTLLAVGILQNISKYTVSEAKDAGSSLGRGNRRTYITNPGHSRRA